MGAQGTATLDFGAFPGSYDVDLDVAAAGVLTTSAVEAWIRPQASTDHSIDEHLIESIKIIGYCEAAGTITIRAFQVTEVFEREPGAGVMQPRYAGDNNAVGVVSPDVIANYRDRVGGSGLGPVRTVAANNIAVPDTKGRVPRIYGQFNVNWVWN